MPGTQSDLVSHLYSGLKLAHVLQRRAVRVDYLCETLRVLPAKIPYIEEK